MRLIALAFVLALPCTRWQPRAIVGQPDADDYPAYSTQAECQTRATSAVVQACRENHGGQDVKECIRSLLLDFQCVPACGPQVPSDQADQVGRKT
jgi:hypothetical protein